MTNSIKPLDTDTLTDASTVSQTIREHEFLQQSLRDEIALLDDEQTDLWVGMGPDKVLVFADTLDEIIHKIKPNKNDDRTVVVEYLSSDPPVMVLRSPDNSRTATPPSPKNRPKTGKPRPHKHALSARF